MKALAIPTLAALALSLSSLFVGSQALAETYQPAGLDDSIQHLKQSVTPPALTAGQPVASVYCQADVSIAGVTSNVICYEKDGFDQLRDQTAAAMTGRTLEPAKVDGVAVPVRIYFRAVYSNLENQPPLLLLPNLGNMQGEFGVDYSAPQERLDHNPWYESYSANDWSEGQMFFSTEGRLTRFVTMVDEDGKPIAVRRIESSKRNKRDAVEMEKRLQDTRFIPGMANGRPERMQYVAVLHFPG